MQTSNPARSSGAVAPPVDTELARRARAGQPAAVRALVLAVATGLLLVTVLEGRVGAGSASGFADLRDVDAGDDQEAIALLERSALAGRQVPYAGTVALTADASVSGGGFSGGSGGGASGGGGELDAASRKPAQLGTQADDTASTTLVEVTNVPGAGTDVQVRGRDSAGQGAVFVANADGAAEEDASPVHLEVDTLAVLRRAFDLVLGEDGARVAGRPTRVVDVRRSDGVLAGRFWVDTATELTLRREVYDASGSVVRASEFLDVRVDPMAAAFRPLAGSFPRSDSEPIAASDYAEVADTWQYCCPPHLAGVLELTGVRQVSGADNRIQLVYSDGLTTASVFQQRGQLDQSTLAGFDTTTYGEHEVYVSHGLVNYAVWAADGVVYTVVCDTPYGLATAVAGFPHRPGVRNDGSLHARFDRGMSKMVSWVNPFD